MNIVLFLTNLPEILGFHLAVIFGLITFDVLTGIAAAIRHNHFRWHWVADFYKTNVIPFMIGYIGYAGFLMFVTPYMELLPQEVEALIAQGLTWVGFGVICANIIASIRDNAMLLAQEPSGVELDVMDASVPESVADQDLPF